MSGRAERPDVLAVTAEAARWRLIGALFERPRAGWRDEVRALASELRSAELERLALEIAASSEGRYLAVFGPGGAVSPREIAYRPLLDPGRMLSEIAGFYRAFGYEPRSEDPADHVAVEAGFVGFLTLKEAFALAGDDGEGVRSAARVKRRFIADHLATFGAELPARLERAGAVELLGAARALSELCPAAPPGA